MDKVRHGIKLVERRCQACGENVFWVPKSSPQKCCSEFCRHFEEGRKYRPVYIRYRRKKIYELTKEDFEDDELD